MHLNRIPSPQTRLAQCLLPKASNQSSRNSPVCPPWACCQPQPLTCSHVLFGRGWYPIWWPAQSTGSWSVWLSLGCGVPGVWGPWSVTPVEGLTIGHSLISQKLWTSSLILHLEKNGPKDSVTGAETDHEGPEENIGDWLWGRSVTRVTY